MKHKKRSMLSGLLAIMVVAGLCGLAPNAMVSWTHKASCQEVSAASASLEAVDKSLGLNYIVSETGIVQGINLNGNSAIVQKAVDPDDESATAYYKIYIDKNSNGIVDAGETAVKLPKIADNKVDDETVVSEYISTSLAIYGVYQAKTTDPIVITFEASGQALYGVYEGETGDITINNTGSIGVIYTAYNSKVVGNIAMNNTGVNSSALFGASGSTVTGNVTMTNQNCSVGTIMAASDSTVTGDVTLTMKSDADFTGSCGTVFAANTTQVTGKVRLYHDGGTVASNEYAVTSGSVYSEDTTEPAVLVDVKNGSSSGYVGAVQGAEITSKAPTAVKYTAKDHKLSGNVYITNGAQVTASGTQPVALDVDVIGASALSGSFYGVYSSGETKSIVGDVDVNVQLDALPSSSVSTMQGIYGNLKMQGSVKVTLKNVYASAFFGTGGYYNSSQDCEVTGDVTVDMTGCQVTGSAYIANYTLVKGALSLQGDAATCLCYMYPTYYSTVGKDVTVSLYGYDTATSKTSYFSVYGVYNKYKDQEYSVGGNLDVKLLGGTFSYIYASNYNSVITGNVVLEMTGIQTMSSNYSYGVYQSMVGGDVTITSDEDCSLVGSFECLYSANVGGKVKIDLQNAYAPESTSSYNYLYGCYNSNVAGSVDISMQGGSWYGVYGMYNNTGTYANTVSGACTVSIQNMTCSNYIYGIYGGVYESAVSASIKNIKQNASSSYCYLYGMSNASINGTLDLTATDIEGMSNVYFLEGGSVAKNITVNLSNMDVKQYFYAKDYSTLSCGGDVTFTISKVNAPNWYGIGGEVSAAGKLALTATDCSSTQYTYISSSSAPA